LFKNKTKVSVLVCQSYYNKVPWADGLIFIFLYSHSSGN
jgi:hypothetical protein